MFIKYRMNFLSEKNKKGLDREKQLCYYIKAASEKAAASRRKNGTYLDKWTVMQPWRFQKRWGQKAEAEKKIQEESWQGHDGRNRLGGSGERPKNSNEG